MAELQSPTKATVSAYPDRTDSLRSSSASSVSSSSSESEAPQKSQSRPTSRRSRSGRPPMAGRPKSSSIIIPKDRDVFQRDHPDYPPDDARAMSPRRNSHDLEKLSESARESLKE